MEHSTNMMRITEKSPNITLYRITGRLNPDGPEQHFPAIADRGGMPSLQQLS